MKASFGTIAILALLISTFTTEASLGEVRFTEVINDVRVLNTEEGGWGTPNQTYREGEIIRTAFDSRAELVAADQSVTRIGANTICFFDSASRTIHMEQGSLLFQTAKEKKRITIQTASTAATVSGGTTIVSTTADGGLKVLVLEGNGRVTGPKSRSVRLAAGEMLFVLPGNSGFSPKIHFRLEDQVQGSKLVQGFANPLPGFSRIAAQVERQNHLLSSGRAVDTGLLVGDTATAGGVQVVDSSVLQQRFREVSRLDAGDLVVGSRLLPEQFSPYPYYGYERRLTANNIEIVGPTVDMSRFDGGYSLLDALGVIEFRDNREHSIAFSESLLVLLAQDFIIPPNFTISADRSGFALMDWDDMHLVGGRYGLNIRSSEGVLMLFAVGAMLLDNVRLSARSIFLEGESITMSAANWGDSQLNGRQVHIWAGEQISLRNVGFGTDVQTISLSAHTIALENISFHANSRVFLSSHLGQLAPNPNSGAAIQPGYVNFVRGVMYGDAPAQNAIGNGIGIYLR